jgi:hypothetical protein
MHRRKIVLLGTDDRSFEEQTLWIDQHLQYQPYLLVKLSLPVSYQSNDSVKRKLLSSTATRSYAANGSGTVTFPVRASQQRTYEATFGDVLQEGQFADLLVIKDSLVSATYTQNGSTASLSDLLAQVHCPVLVLTKPLRKVEQLLLFYDGSSQDFSLIQQFSQDYYHFSTTLPTTLLLLQTRPLPPLQEKLLIEYLKLHYYDLAVHKVSEEYQHLLPIAIDCTKGTMIVSSRRRPLPNFVTNYLPSSSIYNLQFPG